MKIVRITLAVMIAVSCGFLGAGCGSGEEPEAADTPAPSGTPPEHSGAQLELSAFKWEKDGEFAIVEGQVKNISSSPLNDVFTMVRFLDKDGVQIAGAEAGIDSSELAPGQTSTFTTLAEFEGPEVKEVTIEFKFFEGAVIPHVSRD
jgi:hypothetical protein